MHFLYRVRCFASDQGGIRAGHSFTLSESIPKGSTQTDTKFFSSVSVFQIPYGDARTGETQRHRGHRSGRERVGGNSVKQKKVQWRRSLYSTKLCALCVSVFQIPAGMRGRGKHRGTEVTDREGNVWSGEVGLWSWRRLD